MAHFVARRDRHFRLGLVFAFIGLIAFSGCTVVKTNQPLTESSKVSELPVWFTDEGYRYGTLDKRGTTDQLLLVLAFSGGGKRSSSFSYGVLQGLRGLTVTVDGQEHRLLDEIDIINSVSGGSFTAAYYALHRDRIFTDFEADFLHQNLNASIVETLLLPWNWEWMVNGSYGTNDRMAETYDDMMFADATYADLIGKGLPLVRIIATDITRGSVFAFDQNSFDLICSDLSSYPLSRAVAASNGFPVLFTPITLRSHAEQCEGLRPAWIDAAKAEGDALSRRYQLARIAEQYLDPEQTRYEHLMDGGISDNLALRGLLDTVTAFGPDPELLRSSGLDRTRRVVMILADGQASADEKWAKQPTVSAIRQIFDAVSGTQIDRYNFETLRLARTVLLDLVEAIRATRCAQAPTIDGHPCADVELATAHLSLKEFEDPEVRRQLQQIPTGLTLAKEDIDLLVGAGAEQVGASAALRRVIRDLERTPN